MATRQISTITPVLVRKSKKVRPSEVPMMMLGGSPHMVALPPKLAQKNLRQDHGNRVEAQGAAQPAVTAARNRMTVMLSMNMDSTAAMTMKHTSSGTVR